MDSRLTLSTTINGDSASNDGIGSIKHIVDEDS